eukprot:PLAT4747.1.p1 GENE.PLAT4747.1~~PLAT4747.1.p1  ORF type:complete len:417 (-),score=131.80 PLAT4747.1:113-1339(-)
MSVSAVHRRPSLAKKLAKAGTLTGSPPVLWTLADLFGLGRSSVKRRRRRLFMPPVIVASSIMLTTFGVLETGLPLVSRISLVFISGLALVELVILMSLWKKKHFPLFLATIWPLIQHKKQVLSHVTRHIRAAATLGIAANVLIIVAVCVLPAVTPLSFRLIVAVTTSPLIMMMTLTVGLLFTQCDLLRYLGNELVRDLGRKELSEGRAVFVYNALTVAARHVNRLTGFLVAIVLLQLVVVMATQGFELVFTPANEYAIIITQYVMLIGTFLIFDAIMGMTVSVAATGMKIRRASDRRFGGYLVAQTATDLGELGVTVVDEEEKAESAMVLAEDDEDILHAGSDSDEDCLDLAAGPMGTGAYLYFRNTLLEVELAGISITPKLVARLMYGWITVAIYVLRATVLSAFDP